MKNQTLNILLFFSQLVFFSCENTVIDAEGKIKIKNMSTTESASDITHIKIMLSDSEKSIIDTDVQIAPGIIKTFNLKANHYTVYVTSDNKERKCQCIVNSGKPTYISYEKKEEINNHYLLHEVDNF